MKKFIIFIVILSILVVSGWYSYQNFFKKEAKTDYSIQEAQTFVIENGGKIEVKKENPTGIVSNSDAMTVNKDINERMATSLINYWSDSWIYAPLINSSVKINADNTVEYSGSFVLTRALGFAKITGVSQQVIDAVTKYIQPFGASFPIYAKGTVEITNNKVNGSMQDIRISFVPITGIVNTYSNEVNQFFTSQLSRDPKYKIRSLKVADGNIKFDGDVPKNIQYN